MPSSLTSFAEFDALLASAIDQINKLAAEMPDDQPIASIRNQLNAVHGWTRNGRKPEQDEKDTLNFGLIASRYLEGYDDLSRDLFELASYIIYWE